MEVTVLAPPVRCPRLCRSDGQLAHGCLSYGAVVELCLTFGIVVCSAMHSSASFEEASAWVPMASLTVANACRSGVAVVAQRFNRWGPAAALSLLVASCAILVWHVLIIDSLLRSSQPHNDQSNGAEVLAFILALAASALSTTMWYAATGYTHILTDKGEDPPPRPEVETFVVHDVGSECLGSICAICLEEFSPGCLAGKLPCTHVFHDRCVRSWLYTGSFLARCRCPMRCPNDAGANQGSRPRQSEPSILLESGRSTFGREVDSTIWVVPW
ncbi:unnamed protein product [Prorocentrum cordatum]|uniref:RING-type domain-containing protein n=1 Tax=Prorocentrum cordatum TaxID=2364126 RepID=A0ABN9WMA5_9DINO|nr:unnamed protein product [Polarella glacialis]CAK0886621.1 unnamed protein product [Polarella glacialis]